MWLHESEFEEAFTNTLHKFCEGNTPICIIIWMETNSKLSYASVILIQMYIIYSMSLLPWNVLLSLEFIQAKLIDKKEIKWNIVKLRSKMHILRIETYFLTPSVFEAYISMKNWMQ